MPGVGPAGYTFRAAASDGRGPGRPISFGPACLIAARRMDSVRGERPLLPFRNFGRPFTNAHGIGGEALSRDSESGVQLRGGKTTPSCSVDCLIHRIRNQLDMPVAV